MRLFYKRTTLWHRERSVTLHKLLGDQKLGRGFPSHSHSNKLRLCRFIFNMSRLSQIACDVRLKKSATCDSHALENSPETPLLNDQAFDKSFLVTWTEDNEQDNPRNWRPLYKCWLTFLLGMLALSASLGSSIIAPAKEDVGRYLGTGEQQTVLVVSLYVLGFAFGPLLWAPVRTHELR